jgi:hypothetical protein
VGVVSTNLVKVALRRLLRPVAHTLYWLGPAPARHERTQAELAEVRDQLPIVCNTIASQNALAREWMRSREQLTRELEALRADVRRLDVGHRAGETAAPDISPAGPVVAEPAVLNPAKLAAFDSDLRLNLVGEGRPRCDFVNVGSAAGEGIDVVADPGRLPARAGSVAHLRCDRILERISTEELRSSLLPYWLSLLRPGGRLEAVVADAEAMVDAVEAGQVPLARLREALCGGAELGLCSARRLGRALEAAGFGDVVVERPAGARPYEVEVRATRPSTPAGSARGPRPAPTP